MAVPLAPAPNRVSQPAGRYWTEAQIIFRHSNIRFVGLALTVSTGRAVIEDGFVIEITSRVRRLMNRVETYERHCARRLQRLVVDKSRSDLIDTGSVFAGVVQYRQTQILPAFEKRPAPKVALARAGAKTMRYPCLRSAFGGLSRLGGALCLCGLGAVAGSLA